MPDFETKAQFEAYSEILDEKPDAIAVIQGGSQYPDIRGEVWLYQLKSGAHYNPGACEHPHHAGDLPPLFGCNGYAMSVFLTDRFLVDDVIGKTLIIHDRPDDFKTQPAGDAGEKMACGVIQSVLR